MNTIRILPEKVASQIAAGEVIDRPASVVRELIDNSIDAGADRIVVRIENGGKGLIKVSDNGVGMSRDDLLLCVERHATSKIETASDLFSIKSLGFRGEALPSIASVSRMKLTSRPKDRLEGHRLKIAGGKLTAIEETGAPVGTVVEAGALFFNIPARRKFLRAARTETDHIIDTFTRVALPFPGINFKLDDAAKTLMNLPASDQQLPRLSALLGRKVAESITEEQERIHGVGVSVYLAPWELSRTRGDRLFVYVNGRNIRDRLVTRAIIEGYGQRLMKGHYPQAVIFLEIDPSMVDVNVHPTKQEVRFHNSRDVFQAIVSTIEKTLARSFHSLYSQMPDQVPSFVSDVSEHFPEFSESVLTRGIPDVADAAEQSAISELPQIIGQLGNTYILCQVKDGLLMVDQHAAHERVMYENLKKGFDASHIEVQALLVPHKLELSAKEKRVVQEKGDRLSRFGIELEHFGGNTFLLRSVPALLENVEWDSFLSEFLAELEEGEPEDDNILLDKALTVMACHGAIRAGYRMTNEEITHLFYQLEEMDVPTNCPHGRPIFKHFTYYEIEKMFKRVV
ncbi:MAG: DNA mismatch repair endonuclease MutL [Deltaproteobacteria bacterium]|nr:DNA mismatch repair endonuclease MutL [Deltaproteobacteria bacterium]MBW2118446.1 DNA mismatch repair endonuclease MutL [Deltaproteobacteria bacterium]MBW2343324.1 DNA mismatch repair endonuclease MutL [Deltaproteobacteria bacterium]